VSVGGTHHQSVGTKPQSAASRRLLEQLYRENIECLRRYLAGVLGSQTDADDVAHDAFLRLHRCDDLTAYKNCRAVLFKTGYRLALNVIRHRRRSPLDRSTTAPEELDKAPSLVTSAEETLIKVEREIVVAKALDNLSPRCRQVIKLRTVQELSYKEISRSLGLSVSTLEKHFVRGKRACATVLADWLADAA